MTISRRTFIKGLGGGLAALDPSDMMLPRSGLAGPVPAAKTKGSQVTTTICPYCAVGCGLIVYTNGGKLVNVEGDPDHPINQGPCAVKARLSFR